jgi:hypothetical protein
MNTNIIIPILAAAMILIIICYDIRMAMKLKKFDTNKIPMPETLEEKVEFANQMSKLALDIQKANKEIDRICDVLNKPVDAGKNDNPEEDGDKDGDWVADNEPKEEPVVEMVHPHMALTEDVWMQHFAGYEVLDIVYYSGTEIAIDDDNDQLYDAKYCEVLFGGPEMLEKALRKSNSNNTCYIRNFPLRKDICIHVKTIKGERNNEQA